MELIELDCLDLRRFNYPGLLVHPDTSEGISHAVRSQAGVGPLGHVPWWIATADFRPVTAPSRCADSEPRLAGRQRQILLRGNCELSRSRNNVNEGPGLQNPGHQTGPPSLGAGLGRFSAQDPLPGHQQRLDQEGRRSAVPLPRMALALAGRRQGLPVE